MSTHESKTQDEFEAIRSDVQFLIAHPVEGREFGDSIRELPNLSLPRAEKLFQIIREEVKELSNQGHNLGLYLKETALSSITGEDCLDHELAHLRKAVELGVDLEQCCLRYAFLEDEIGWLVLWMEFKMPPETDPYTKALITLAPDEISIDDFYLITREAPKLTQAQREELSALFEEKTGIDLRMIGREN
jgi:hypothetical protein